MRGRLARYGQRVAGCKEKKALKTNFQPSGIGLASVRRYVRRPSLCTRIRLPMYRFKVVPQPAFDSGSSVHGTYVLRRPVAPIRIGRVRLCNGRNVSKFFWSLGWLPRTSGIFANTGVKPWRYTALHLVVFARPWAEPGSWFGEAIFTSLDEKNLAITAESETTATEDSFNADGGSQLLTNAQWTRGGKVRLGNRTLFFFRTLQSRTTKGKRDVECQAAGTDTRLRRTRVRIGNLARLP